MLTSRTILSRAAITSCTRNFRSIAPSRLTHLPPRIKFAEEDLQEKFLKGSGPGGQKINKTASAVQLKHVPSGIVVKCQATRSRSQNRQIARRLLADRVEEEQKGDESRTALKKEAARKKKASSSKKARRKYRKLEEAAEEAVEADETSSMDGEHPGGKASTSESSAPT